jgi:hypothetical protein
MKIQRIVAGVALLSSITAWAGLVEDIDKLTPEEAHAVTTKLQAKTLQPIPESFFTRLSLGVSFGATIGNPSAFDATLNSVHGNFKSLDWADASLTWKIDTRYLLGFDVGGLMRQSDKQIAASTVEKVNFGGGYFHFQAGYQIPLGQDWLLAPAAGLGGIYGMVEREVTSDALLTTYVFRLYGVGPSAAVSLPILYKLNPIWTVGLDNRYFYGRVTKVKRADQDYNGIADLNFSGYQIGFKTAINL